MKTVSAQRIIITDSPNNQYVLVNGTAYFSCRYIGTNEIPLWLINGRSHVLLPSRHKYVNGILRVSSVKVSDNGTTYQCFFQEVSSGTGILYVVPTGINMLHEINIIKASQPYRYRL